MMRSVFKITLFQSANIQPSAPTNHRLFPEPPKWKVRCCISSWVNKLPRASFSCPSWSWLSKTQTGPVSIKGKRRTVFTVSEIVPHDLRRIATNNEMMKDNADILWIEQILRQCVLLVKAKYIKMTNQIIQVRGKVTHSLQRKTFY